MISYHYIMQGSPFCHMEVLKVRVSTGWVS